MDPTHFAIESARQADARGGKSQIKNTQADERVTGKLRTDSDVLHSRSRPFGSALPFAEFYADTRFFHGDGASHARFGGARGFRHELLLLGRWRKHL